MRNKKGLTLIELIAYIAIVGIVGSLLAGILTIAIKTHDRVYGQGALDTEAVMIMNTIMSQANTFKPEYIQECSVNCVELVIEKVWTINFATGILEQLPVDSTMRSRLKIRIEDNNLYLGDVKLNREGYAVEEYQLASNGVYLPNVSYECNTDNEMGVCQSFVIKIRLALYKVNKNGERKSETTIYENRFAY